MGNLFVRVLIAFVVLVLIVMGIGMLLPRDYEVVAETTIDAPPDAVFPWIVDLKQWQHWSMFSPERIEGLKIEYGPQSSGEGAVQSWTEPRGRGKLWIESVEAPTRIEYQMEFLNFPRMESQIELTSVDGNTKVRWTSHGSLPSGPFYGFFGQYFANGMKFEYDQALRRLKEQVEAVQPKSVP